MIAQASVPTTHVPTHITAHVSWVAGGICAFVALAILAFCYAVVASAEQRRERTADDAMWARSLDDFNPRLRVPPVSQDPTRAHYPRPRGAQPQRR